MKHKTILLLLFLLTATPWLAAQHAVWWGGSPPPSNTARDHSISYGNGFAWQVALGTAQSEDVAHDAIAVSSGGYLVVGSNYFYEGYTVTHTNLVLYRLTGEGDLMWEKDFYFEDYKDFVDLQVIENPNESFFIVGIIRSGSNPRKCFLLHINSDGDELHRHTWLFSEGNFSKLRIAKGADDTFFVTCWRVGNDWQHTEVYKLNSSLDTLMYVELPYYEFLHKAFGFSCTGGSYEQIRYYYNLNNDLTVLDSFPDPFGDLANGMYPMQSLRNGNNVFFRTELSNPKVFKMATTTDTGEVLNINPSCFSGDDIWWFQGWGAEQQEFSDGSICAPFRFYFDYYNDNISIGLVKLSLLGEHLGDTAITRAEGDMMLVKVLEGADGRPVIFGTGENGPLGGPITGEDIFIAKIENWNPVSAPTLEANGTLPLRVFPNPVGQTVIVELPQGVKGTLTVTSVNGTKLQSQNVNDSQLLTLNTNQWPKGQVVVSLHTHNGVYSTKLIKNF